MTDTALLLMAHGSRNAEARAEYVRIRDALALRLPDERIVFSVLEFPDEADLPSIRDGWQRCLDAGARRVAALPFFLFPAGHVREDLPTELREARTARADAELDLLPPLGVADELLDVLADRADEALATLPETDGQSAVLLVGAGTSDPDANGDLCKAARLLWERERQRFPLVETAWVSLTEPSVQGGVERCLLLGARRIAVVPYFLNTGVLLRRIDARLAEVRKTHPDLLLARSEHMGLHPRLLDLLERKAREALDGASERTGLMAVCGRPSCNAVAEGRASLLRQATPTT